MKQIINSKLCVGCGSCLNICPTSAITMTCSSSGFEQPHIIKDKCVNCNLCKKVCPVLEYDTIKNDIGKSYGAQHVNSEVLFESSSGGAFSAFAEKILEEKGVVYGVASFNNRIIHTRIDDICDLYRFRGSKYVQSDMKTIFNSILVDMTNNKKVLFVGTPCQCAAIKLYIKNKRIELDNLLILDFICHGVTSPGIYKDYIDYCNNHYKIPVKEHRFRLKTKGWSSHLEGNVLVDGSIDSSSYCSQLYKSIFHSHLAIRESCFQCKYATLNRVSDITIGDFWGLKLSRPNMYDEKGVSFIIANTKIGDDLILNTSEKLKIFTCEISDTNQPNLYGPTNMPKEYERFQRLYMSKGFNAIVVKYFHGGRFRRFITDIIKKILHIRRC